MPQRSAESCRGTHRLIKHKLSSLFNKTRIPEHWMISWGPRHNTVHTIFKAKWTSWVQSSDFNLTKLIFITMPATRSIPWHLFQPSLVRKAVRKPSKSLSLEPRSKILLNTWLFQMTGYVLRTTVVGYAPKSHLKFSELSSTIKELFQTHKHLEKTPNIYKAR